MPNAFRRFTKRIFIVSNIVVALLFLAGMYAYLFDPQRWWFLGLLALGAFYLLLLLLLFVLFWLFVKPGWSLISVITILIAFKPLGNMIPYRIASSFDKKKSRGAIRIMSWNVEHFDILEHKTHPETKEKMLALINEYQPDIACFQEMVGGEASKDAINYVPDIARRLGFATYYYSFNPKLDFDGNHHFGIIIFSKFPVINRQTVSFYPNDYNSIFQYADIVKGTDTLRVFNIHLQSLKFSAGNLQYIDRPTVTDETDLEKSKSVISKLKKGFLKRRVQADRIRGEIDKSPYPVIVCGDFNDVPNSYAYHTISNGLQNSFAAAGTGLGRTFSGISPTLRIDNIFAGKKYTVLQYTRINKKLSDHFPVFADLKTVK